MRKNTYAIVLLLLAVLGTAVVAVAQEVTVEPPSVPTVEVTVEVPILPTAEITIEPISEATAEPVTQPSTQPTAEATAEAPVETELETTPTDDSAYLRIAHFVPDASSVDVYVSGSIAVRNLSFPSVSKWIAVEPGSYSIAIAASDQAAGDTVMAPFDVSVSADTWQTVAVIGSADAGTLQATLITEDYSDLLPSTAGFTFFNGLEGSPPVNFVRDDVVFYAQVGFPGPDTTTSFSSLQVDSGIFDVSVSEGNDPSNVFAARSGLELSENAYTLVALVGTLDSPRLFVLTTDRSEVAIVRGILPKPGQLLDALRANENLTAFADALESAGLVDLLSGTQQYTLLAPANFVMDDPALTAEQQANMLRSYIVEGKYTSQELVNAGTLTALDGTALNVTTDDTAIFVNNVQVIDVNIPATNGVIHMLNGLLNQQS